MIRAVAFHLGGVILESPLHVITAYEASSDIVAGTINQVVAEAGSRGAWAQYERAEVGYDEFRELFMRECRAAGAEVDVENLMAQIEAATVPRPMMLVAVEQVKATSRSVAALTNNWEPLGDNEFTDRFDTVVESSVEGVRKPQRRIYEIMLERLGIPASQVLFLDDIGSNLKTARAMGMTTIKVVQPQQAISDMWMALDAH